MQSQLNSFGMEKRKNDREKNDEGTISIGIQ
jgi:hypothetical protein